MIEVIGLRFKSTGKTYYFAPRELTFQKGEQVIVETSRGEEIGEVVFGNRKVMKETVVSPLKPVVRRATEDDLKRAADNRKKEREAFAICEKKIAEHKLDMNLVEVECAFDSSKMLFFFTAEGRVDFRDLVKVLAGIFRTRIELRQIGVRDEAKMLGGMGICGRPLCCHSFLADFQPVSIKMAKEQSLSLNPTKISGTCGRLMCCLKYEQDTYEKMRKIVPRVDSLVQTKDGNGVVVDNHVLKGIVKVKLENPDITAVQTYQAEDVAVIRSGGKKPKAKGEAGE